MKKLVVSVFLVGLVATSVFAVPQYLSYAGRATKSGRLINTPQAVTVNLYTTANGGIAFYTTTNANVPFYNGVYNFDFGPIDPSVLVGKDVSYLETTIAGETLLPRTKMQSSAFTLQSGGLSHNGASVVLDSNGNVIISGNVGVGTSNPTAKLSVSGNMKISNGLTVGTEITANAVAGTLRWNPNGVPTKESSKNNFLN